MSRILPYIFAVGVLAVLYWAVSSAGDPRNAADAARTEMLAQVEAAQAAQKVAQQQADYQRQQAEQTALAQQWVLWKTVIGWSGVIGFSSIVVANSFGAAAISMQIWRAVAMAAWLKSRQIPQDPRTGQLPGFYNERMLTNPDAGEVIDTTRPKLASMPQIGMIRDVRQAGLAARNGYRGKGTVEVLISNGSEVTNEQR